MILAALLGISSGSSTQYSFLQVLQSFFNPEQSEQTLQVILWEVRFPRVILAAVTGASLAAGGAVFQALLRNSLAEPYILGVSGGSAVGAISGMLLGLSQFPGVTGLSFLGSMVVVALVVLTGWGKKTVSGDSLLLGGVMMNAFCGAGIMFLIFISQNSQIHQILFWLMGDLSMADPERIPVLLMVIPLFIFILFKSRSMNLLMAGRETAVSLGINDRQVSFQLLVVTSLMISLVVTQSGLIGFVGLVIPHIFRLLLGADHRILIPASLLGGASYLIFCDWLARTLPSLGEMPVGIITAMIGAPVFIFLLRRSRT